MVRFIRKITAFLGWAFAAILILTAAFVIWGNQNGWQFDAVLTGSMEPSFKVGGLVIVKPVDAETLNPGDAISFKLPGIDTLICHRIINIQYLEGEKYFQTQGDANKAPDRDLVPAAGVKGQAIFYIPGIGRLGEIKSLGLSKVTLLGIQVPFSALIVLIMGLLFIGLTLKDTIEDNILPSKKLRREMGKKQNARLDGRRQLFKKR